MGNYSGMVRSIDKLGRVVLPAEMKRELGLENEMKVEFHFENDSIIIKKYHEHCMFCDAEKELVEYNYKKQDDNEKDADRKVYICKNCLTEITELK